MLCSLGLLEDFSLAEHHARRQIIHTGTSFVIADAATCFHDASQQAVHSYFYFLFVFVPFAPVDHVVIFWSRAW